MEASTSLIRSRISNACDGCKSRKVKCDGNLPCSYCSRRQRPHLCRYSPQKNRRSEASRQNAPTRRRSRQQPAGAPSSPSPSPITPLPHHERPTSSGTPLPILTSSRALRSAVTVPAHLEQQQQQQHHIASDAAEDETEVPREARLHTDAQGKLIFIGDCAPLSFFQSVRQLVNTKVGPNAFAPETSRFSVLENAPARSTNSDPSWKSSSYATLERGGGGRGVSSPLVDRASVLVAVERYFVTTAGLVDFWDDGRLKRDMIVWATLRGGDRSGMTSLLHYLVLAIGLQVENPEAAHIYFDFARERAYACLTGEMGVETVQVFLLITVYMLCSCQMDGAFLFFGIAGRAAYSIGLHRAEVNARFASGNNRQRDRLWKSLRVVDLYLSTLMGRPPATSDVDCTVSVRDQDAAGNETFDLINASAQILLIAERIVFDIYSRRKISLRLTEKFSLQLREWSGRWLEQLKGKMRCADVYPAEAVVTGACRVLSTYYYSVMLVSRPWQMYEVMRRIANENTSRSSSPTSGKSRLADACIDAACVMVETVLNLIEGGFLTGRVPIIVSWLFSSSLVLGLGLLGGFGRILERYTRMSIRALDHFAQSDAHARQYSLIGQTLLSTAVEYLERQELNDRMRRTESSSQLFGMNLGIPQLVVASANRPSSDVRGADPDSGPDIVSVTPDTREPPRHDPQEQRELADVDSAFLGLTESRLHTPDRNFWFNLDQGDVGAALNLFPLLGAGTEIDLANYL